VPGISRHTPGIGTRSFTDALSNEKVSTNKPPTSVPLSGFGVSSFADASWNASRPTMMSSSKTHAPPAVETPIQEKTRAHDASRIKLDEFSQKESYQSQVVRL